LGEQEVASQIRPPARLTPRWRWISLAELLVGAAIVIGHNVYHRVPNEVPILFVLGLVSLRLRDGGWAAMGLCRPSSWRKIVLLALGAAALRIVLGSVVIDPLTAHWWPPAKAPGTRTAGRPAAGSSPRVEAPARQTARSAAARAVGMSSRKASTR